MYPMGSHGRSFAYNMDGLNMTEKPSKATGGLVELKTEELVLVHGGGGTDDLTPDANVTDMGDGHHAIDNDGNWYEHDMDDD